MELERRKQAHHALWHPLGSLDKRVALREVGVGKNIEPAARPDELAGSGEAADILGVNPEGRHIPKAQHAQLARQG
jgi:hypothetical protein